MKFRPCIDLHEGKVKQIVGSTIGDAVVENFVSEKNPSYYANLFRRDGYKGGHVIMLGTGNEAAAKEALAAWPGGFQIGGGISRENALTQLENGASHVIVTSYVFREGKLDFERLKELSDLVGKERLVIDLSCAKKADGKYYVMTDRWTVWSDFEVTAESIDRLAEYCDEVLVHAISVEGKQGGIDAEILRILGRVEKIKVTYAGGVRDFDDIETIRVLGMGKVDFTIGSALDIFGGKMCYDGLVEKLYDERG
ncbi:MAG: phosphoribosylformimino-5-aminoimidazole carboxamide ribotide isomerase [Bacillota bacterium]